MKTKVECINCKKLKSKNIVSFQMHVLVSDNEHDEDGDWEEVERVQICLKCLDESPVAAMTVVDYLRGAS